MPTPTRIASPTHFIGSSIDHPFEFPFAGNTKSESRQKQLSAGDLTFEVFNVATGNHGIVRQLQIIQYNGTPPSGPVKDSISHFSVKIYYDGEVSPTISIPMSSLVGYEYPTTIVATTAFKTPFLDMQLPAVGLNKLGFTLKYPIPYTNGIKIEIVSDSNSYLSWFWITTVSQDSLPQCWNRNLRMKVTRSNETVSAATGVAGTIASISGASVVGSGTDFSAGHIGKAISFLDFASGYVSISDEVITAVADSTHLTLERTPIHPAYDARMFALISTTPGSAAQYVSPHQFINLAAGKAGWVASVFGSHTTSDPPTSKHFVLETSVRFYRDQDTVASWEFSGMEDFFSSAFYFVANFQGDVGGVICFGAGTVGAYRQFYNSPLRFDNGIRGTIYNTWYNNTTYNWTTIYYEEI